MSAELLSLPLDLPVSKLRSALWPSHLMSETPPPPPPASIRSQRPFSLQKRAPPPRFNLSRRGAPGWEDGWGAAGFAAARPHHNQARSACMGGEKRAKTPSDEARAAHTVSTPSKCSLAGQTRRFLLSLRRRQLLRRRPPPCPLPRWRATMRAPHEAARTHKSAPSGTRGGAAASGTHSPARRVFHAARAPSTWPDAAHGAPRGWRGIAIVAARAGGCELNKGAFCSRSVSA